MPALLNCATASVSRQFGQESQSQVQDDSRPHSGNSLQHRVLTRILLVVVARQAIPLAKHGTAPVSLQGSDQSSIRLISGLHHSLSTARSNERDLGILHRLISHAWMRRTCSAAVETASQLSRRRLCGACASPAECEIATIPPNGKLASAERCHVSSGCYLRRIQPPTRGGGERQRGLRQSRIAS